MAGFTAELAARVNERFASTAGAERAEIYTFAKEVALESYKNGLAAARRENAPQKRGARPAQPVFE